MISDKLVVLDSVIFFPEHRERLAGLAKTVVEYNTCHGEDQVLSGSGHTTSNTGSMPRYAIAHGVDVPAIPDYIRSLADGPHFLDSAFRLVDALLDESHVLVYDSRDLTRR